MIKEFKEFIASGNVMAMAVGIIIGGAFTLIVTSLVDDILNPIISIFTGGVDFSGLKIMLGTGENAASVNYGSFIMAVINFLIIAFVIFMMVRSMNKFQDKIKKKEEVAPTTKACPYCKEIIAIDATKCPHCTADIEAVEAV
ncbi:MAG: large conductance mechanosensitive channel protein MscL [Anaerovoracaceae bacterium]|jgi:large conductance mechanosensitive channel